MNEPLLLTVTEAASLLRISRNSAYLLISRNELPAIRLGRAIRVPYEALEASIRGASFADAGQPDRPAVR